ncbi:MAG TPA: hypothetical protein VGV38_14065 [Pyrinomonadaceae bacterium]|nr:hypothetical protein [Pyrinomonadaceae bacterium]
MTRNRIILVALGILVLVGGLGLLRFAGPRRREVARGGGADGAAREQLSVGFLPVT